MKRQFIPLMTVIMLTGIIFGASCKKDNNNSTPQPITADTAIVVANFSPADPYSFFSFKNGVISNADSATSKWDFGLRLTTFLVNSNASGPGNAGVIVQNGIFENIASAPTSGYAYDTTASKLAITDGTWYNYDINTHVFTPIPGKIFVFRTADNHYAKMEILGATYEPFSGMVPVKIDYKIRFIYQTNGTGF